ncbi:50S ribosomal protein L14e [archaeon]|nr:50S ribosomal protein L14e [archaeon]
MYEIGRIVIKIAGRDAGNTAIVVDKIDDNIVLIDGNVRRRKCNIKHLEPTQDVLKIKKCATTAEVHKMMSAAEIKVKAKKKVKRSPKKKIEKTSKK